VRGRTLLPCAGAAAGAAHREVRVQNISEFAKTVNLFDVFLVVFLFGFFVLGYIQGTIRRLVGIASIVFSFYLALQLNNLWLGTFLATNWTQYPKEYSFMVGYLVIFIAAVVAFTLVIQGTYKRTQLFPKYPVVDEVLGGVLGVVQGMLLLTFVVIILDQYYLYTGIPADPDEFGFLRQFWVAMNTSGTGTVLHTAVIPGVITLTAFLVPQTVKDMYNL
jgi:uncharacterized membrane protein required for colicin V production